MKSDFIKVLLFCLAAGTFRSALASHITGGEITYAAAPGVPNQYVVTVKLYRDCYGISFEDPVTVQWVSPSGCGASGSASLPLVPGTGPGNEILTGNSPLCAISTCNGGTSYGLEEWVYTGLINLGSACTDWEISYNSCCRNSAISGPPGNIYVAATLDNLNFPSDSSAVFNHPPVATLCVGRTYQLDISGIDPDGDSLMYFLTNAWVSSPLPSMHPPTGIITFTPGTVELGVLLVFVHSYSRTTGQLIGTLRREIQVNIETVCHDGPTFDSLHTLNNTSLLSCQDSLLQIKLYWGAQCTTLATNGSDFRLFSPSLVQVPVTQALAYNCVNGLSDSMALVLGAPGLFENGMYTLIVVTGTDSNTIADTCGTAIPANDTSFFSFNNCFTGIEELNSDRFYLTLNPVPVTSNLNVQTNVPGTKEVQVFNVLGEIVQSFRSGGFSWDLDLAGLPGGTYSFSLKAGNLRKSAFFVVLR